MSDDKTPFSRNVDFNVMVCEAMGIDADRVAAFTITASGGDSTYVTIEWVPDMQPPGDPLKGRFRLVPVEEPPG